MNKIFPRLSLVAIVTIFSLCIVLPIFNNTKKIFDYNLSLGLDLRGGVHLLLEADFDQYLSEKYSSLIPSIKKIIKNNRVKVESIKFSKDEITVKLQNNLDSDTRSNLLEQISRLETNLLVDYSKSDPDLIVISYHEQHKSILLNSVIEQSMLTLRNRVDNTGTKEPVIQKQGSNKIILEMPGLSDANSLKNAIGKTARMSFHIVTDQKNQDTMTLKNTFGEELNIIRQPELTGDTLQNATVTFDEYSRPCVSFKLNPKGTKLFAEATSQNIGKRLAIVLDDLIITAPNINTPIKEGAGIITGNFSVDEAMELVTFLNSGALAVKLEVVEEKVIGPTLGEKSIQDMKLAGGAAIMLVVSFMVFYYRILGVFASISLGMSLLYMFCMLAMFNATLTVPGIAGIILTIGMAVDANILIYERIKEDLHKQYSLVQAVRLGFKTALGTILDSNLTTLIVAGVLYTYGTGPIRGFAVTLTAGILASMFSSIVITKLLIDIWLRNFKNLQIIKNQVK